MGIKEKEDPLCQTGLLVSPVIFTRLTWVVLGQLWEYKWDRWMCKALLSISTVVPAASSMAIGYMVG